MKTLPDVMTPVDFVTTHTHTEHGHKPRLHFQNHSFRRLIILFFLSFSFLISYGQEDVSCGTPDSTPEEMKAIIDIVDSNSSSRSTNSEECGGCEIPIHVYILMDSLGNEPSPEGWTVQRFADELEEVNQFFTNEMSFYICDVDTIINTEWFNSTFGLGGGLGFGIDDLVNVAHDDNARSIYIVNYHNQSGFWHEAEQAISFRANPRSTTITHEMGHSFGLAHTFVTSAINATPNDNACAKLLPDNTCNDYCHPLIYECVVLDSCTNAEILAGGCTGDFIYDTNVDISRGLSGDPTFLCTENVMDSCILY